MMCKSYSRICLAIACAMGGAFLQVGLFVPPAWGQDLLEALPEMPQYSISAKVVNGRMGRTSIELTYRRTRAGSDGAGFPALEIASGNRISHVIGTGFSDLESGKLVIQNPFAKRGEGPKPCQIYFVNAIVLAEEIQVKCLVSNAARIGNASDTLKSRPWNDREQAAYQKEQTQKVPPKVEPPAGYQILTREMPRLKGMPVLVGRYGEWVEAELLDIRGKAGLRLEASSKVVQSSINGWLAVSDDVLHRAIEEPSSFEPSMRLVPGTTTELPAGFLSIPDAAPLFPGTPVKALRASGLEDAVYIGQIGEKVRVCVEYGTDSWKDWMLEKRLVFVSDATHEKLKTPTAEIEFRRLVPFGSWREFQEDETERIEAEKVRREREKSRNEKKEKLEKRKAKRKAKFGSELSSATQDAKGDGNPSALRLENHPIDIAIPSDAERVPANVLLPAGTTLAACWGNRWQFLTVLSDSQEAAVPIHWEGFGKNSDCRIDRSQLIIRKKDLRPLQQKQVRQYTSKGGKFTVVASLVSKNKTTVTLKREDGTEVTLPIAQLSESDQEWISQKE